MVRLAWKANGVATTLGRKPSWGLVLGMMFTLAACSDSTSDDQQDQAVADSSADVQNDATEDAQADVASDTRDTQDDSSDSSEDAAEDTPDTAEDTPDTAEDTSDSVEDAADGDAADPCAEAACGDRGCEIGDAGASCSCEEGYIYNDGGCDVGVLHENTPFDDERFSTYGGMEVSEDGESVTGTSIDGCEDTGISASIDLPDEQPDAPLLITAAWEVTDCDYENDPCDLNGDVDPELRLGGRLLARPDLWPDNEDDEGETLVATSSVQVCIAEWAYQSGETLELSFGTVAGTGPGGPGGGEECTGAYTWLSQITELSIREATAEECPELADNTENSEFSSGDTSGWEVDERWGNGSRGVVADGDDYLYERAIIEESCDGTVLSQTIAVPWRSGDDGLALEVELETDVRLPWKIWLGTDDLNSINNEQESEGLHTVVNCLPPWAYGSSQTLEITLGEPAGNEQLDCDEGDPIGTIGLRRAELVDNSDCSTSGGLTNGDFSEGLFGWWLQYNYGNDQPYVTIEDDEDERFLKIRLDEACTGARFIQYAIPDASDEWLSFRYRATLPDLDETGTNASASAGRSWVELGESADWQTVKVCLPEDAEPDGMYIKVGYSVDGTCRNFFDGFLDVDDVQFGSGGECRNDRD